MSNHDEEIPLLSVGNIRTPLPRFQLTIVFLLHVSEVLTTTAISPFLPQLIRDIGITHGDDKKIGYYSGTLESSYYAAQVLTMVGWGSLSDRIGRRPVLIVGLLSTALSMLSFGLSKSFLLLVTSRCVNGALNGNFGVVKTMMAELTDSTNAPEAFAILAISWTIGAAIGPAIGGGLARPVDQYPSIFGSSELFKAFPYLLPCIVLLVFELIIAFIVWEFLKETVSEPISVNKLLPRGLRRLATNIPLLNKAVGGPADTVFTGKTVKQRSYRSLLTPRVIVSTLIYSMFTLIDNVYRSLVPIFFAMPISLGGLGFTPAVIGLCLAVYGLFEGPSKILFFPLAFRRFGAKTVLLLGVSLAFPMFVIFPLMSLWAKHYGFVTNGIWVLVVIQMLFYLSFSFAYYAILVYIAAASPDEHSIGATNGIAHMAGSVTGAFGPSLSTSLYSLSMEHNYLGGWLVWWLTLALTAGGVVTATFVPKEVWKRSGEDSDCAVLDAPIGER